MSDISAQELFNGPGFNEDYILEKAKREFDRMKKCHHPYFIYDHIINFSITIASLSDWTFHLCLANDPKWNRKSEMHFTNWVRSQSPEVATFIDVSNESKHAHRKHPNFLAEKVGIYPVWDESKYTDEQLKLLKTKGFQVSTKGGDVRNILMVPSVLFGSESEYLYDMAESAIQWWKSCDLTQATPMNRHFNLIN